MSCGIGYRHSLDQVLLWLWLWPASYSSDSFPTLGTFICHRCGRKSKKKKKTKSRNAWHLCLWSFYGQLLLVCQDRDRVWKWLLHSANEKTRKRQCCFSSPWPFWVELEEKMKWKCSLSHKDSLGFPKAGGPFFFFFFKFKWISKSRTLQWMCLAAVISNLS